MKNKLQKNVERTAIFTSIATPVLIVVYQYTKNPVLFSIAVTLGTVWYHFVMRLLVSWLVNRLVKTRLDYENIWFRPKKFEMNLYRRLRVKKWKKRVPTYVPQDFSLKQHTPEEIIQSMCIAELVHEIIIVLGYITVLFCFITGDWNGDFWVFLITATIAGGVDSIFVIVQRYNRPRLVQLRRQVDVRR